LSSAPQLVSRIVIAGDKAGTKKIIPPEFSRGEKEKDIVVYVVNTGSFPVILGEGSSSSDLVQWESCPTGTIVQPGKYAVGVARCRNVTSKELAGVNPKLNISFETQNIPKRVKLSSGNILEYHPSLTLYMDKECTRKIGNFIDLPAIVVPSIHSERTSITFFVKNEGDVEMHIKPELNLPDQLWISKYDEMIAPGQVGTIELTVNPKDESIWLARYGFQTGYVFDVPDEEDGFEEIE
jgi:hypothetical protein